jgi:hypothetical protein
MSPSGSVATEPFSERSDLCLLLPKATIRDLGLEGRVGPLGEKCGAAKCLKDVRQGQFTADLPAYRRP